MKDFEQLLKNLISQKKETPWLEFKDNNEEPEMIGKLVSALSNMACLEKRNHAYIVWGIKDSNHEILGTSFEAKTAKKGNEDFLPWLLQNLSPRINLSFSSHIIENKLVTMLEIAPAENFPTKFKGQTYCRVESYVKNLSDYPSIERSLWQALMKEKDESLILEESLSEDEVSTLLNLPAYFQVLHLPLPKTREEMIQCFVDEEFLIKNEDGTFNITKLGALTFAFDLNKFATLSRKEVTVSRFKGSSRNEVIDSQYFTSGYVLSFENIVRFTMSLLSLGEPVAKNGLTLHLYRFPEIVIREGITNMLIHQDLSIRGVSPMININDESIEFTNPGTLEINPDRIIDTTPKSRNEKLASFLRRIGIGDEKGTGYDKICAALEEENMPAPEITYDGTGVHLKIQNKKDLKKYSKKEKLDVVYFHACLCYQNGIKMTNETLRKRLAMTEKDRYVVSRLLKDAIVNGRIKLENPQAGNKDRTYLPYWA